MSCYNLTMMYIKVSIKLYNDQTEVSEIFNKFFINVAKDIGSSNIKFDDIKNNCQQTLYRQFSFL